MPRQSWIRIDIGRLENPPRSLTAEDQCYFLQEYTSGGGYSASECNNLIINFKKKREYEGTPQWKWKLKAVERFARDLADLIGNQECVVAAIPTSKAEEDPRYDPRFELLLERLQAMSPGASIEKPIFRAVSATPLHEGGIRTPGSIYNTLGWRGFRGPVPEQIILIDDMITHGSTYSACKRHLIGRYPVMQVVGLFWARCIWKNSAAEDVPDDIESE